jgi:hypothetical protein
VHLSTSHPSAPPLLLPSLISLSPPRLLRIGRATDESPLVIPHVLARVCGAAQSASSKSSKGNHLLDQQAPTATTNNNKRPRPHTTQADADDAAVADETDAVAGVAGRRTGPGGGWSLAPGGDKEREKELVEVQRSLQRMSGPSRKSNLQSNGGAPGALTLNPNPTPYTLHPTPYTLHPTPYTPYPAPYTLNPTPHTLHPTP